MDCPSEEQMIRMKLSDMRTIKSLDFDIPNRKLIVFHTHEKDEIFKKLEELKFDTSIIESFSIDNYETPIENVNQERFEKFIQDYNNSCNGCLIKVIRSCC